MSCEYLTSPCPLYVPQSSCITFNTLCIPFYTLYIYTFHAFSLIFHPCVFFFGFQVHPVTLTPRRYNHRPLPPQPHHHHATTPSPPLPALPLSFLLTLTLHPSHLPYLSTLFIHPLLLPDAGIDEPRTGYDGYPLPSARVVSAHLHRDEGRHDHAVTIMTVAWGQAIDHDMTLTAETKGE